MKKKLIFLIISGFSVSVAQSQNTGRLFDQPMQLKNFIINIQSDAFVATTFIEIEFYNPNQKEIEGLYRFQLDPGQAVTGLQLELNGKYREGSIEERWKARSVYSTIVGKRVDPALLQYEYNNNYRLNIFPVPAKGSRKITMTIQQLLSSEKTALVYRFPFYRGDTAAHFELNIRVNNSYLTPVVKRGLLAGKLFQNNSRESELNWITDKLRLSGEISFEIPMIQNGNIFCTKSVEQIKYYATKLIPQVPEQFEIHPKKIAIYWDASASASERNLKKEINFLQQYISRYNIDEITIMPFNSCLQDTATFYPGNEANGRWEHYLRSLVYDGPTQLGCLDLSNLTVDAVLVFSDGKSTYGKNLPNIGASLVYCINSARDCNLIPLREIAGANGGKCIDLNELTTSEAINESGKAKNWLLGINLLKGLTCDQLFPISTDKIIMLTGMLPPSTNTLTLQYGHGNKIVKTEIIHAEQQDNCTNSTIEKISMLQKFSAIQQLHPWENVLEFGLKEKVVTTNTSFIVLEKVEDYIKYNISPPKDLEEECEKLNYVKKDTRIDRQRLRTQDEFEIVSNVVNSYNEKIRQWDKTAETIQLSREQYEFANNSTRSKIESNSDLSSSITGPVLGVDVGTSAKALSEVVVTAYGQTRKQSVIGSASYFRGNQILPGLSIEQNLSGRVAGLEVQSSGLFGNQSNIIIRGAATANGNQPLFIIDGVAVSGNPNNYINVNDIESITVLKDASASAIYGGRGANGVIIINSKRSGFYGYRSYSNKPYRLKDMEDIEYMQQLKTSSPTEKLSVYNQLRIDHGKECGFYFDVAQHLFETGLKTDAYSILLNAAEVASGDASVLKAIAYTFENWGYFDEAIFLYEQLWQSSPNDFYTCRDLAWAYYQHGNYQKAITLLYEALKSSLNPENGAALLNDLNAIVSVQKNKLDISMIPSALIKPLPVDLRIVVQGNKNDVYYMTIIEPDGTRCSSISPTSKNGGYFSKPHWQYHADYEIKNAMKGRYRIRVDYYDYTGRIPSFVRIVSFRNFGKADQSINIENIMMDNQFGEVEIGEVKWNK